MIKKSNSTSLALATIAILGQPPSVDSFIKVFFALWPENAAREQLDRLAKQLAITSKGSRIRSENLHLTLLFIGEIEPSLVPKLCQIVSSLKQSSFDLVLDKISFWKRAGIVIAGTKQPPAGLLALVQDLQQALSTSGIHYDAREFKPHVTLVRNAKHHPLPDLLPTISWKVTGWSLVQSQPTSRGVSYRALASWKLESHNPC